MKRQNELNQSMNLYLNGDIDEKNSKEIVLSIMNTPSDIPINLYINSIGGDIVECLGIINIIENRNDITTVNIGVAWSGAFLIFLAGNKRHCYKKSTFIYHQLKDYDLSEIDTQGLKNLIKQNEILEKIMIGFVTEKTTINKNTLISSHKCRKDLVWTVNEALRLGIVHKILD